MAFWFSCRCRRRSIPDEVIAAIDPDKDVDGFHPLNVGRIAIGLPALAPCTPLGLRRAGEDRACVARRPRCAGDRPLDHRRQAARPASLARERDGHGGAFQDPRPARGVAAGRSLFAAIGRPEFVRGDWIKPGATVIDVGTNRVDARRQARVVGDVAFAEAREVAGAITPVPGGVGPMTIACLLANTLRAACAHAGLPAPVL